MQKKLFANLRHTMRQKTQETRKSLLKESFYEYSFQMLSEKKNILDFGCGLGQFLKFGKGMIFGIDVNLDSLIKARKHSFRIVQGNLLDLPFRGASFDGINCSHVIEHFCPDEAYQLLVEMNRVLKTDGIMVISTPVLWDGFFDDLTHIRPYSPNAILHYYGEGKSQTTKRAIESQYEVVEIKWRYSKVQCEPFFIPKGGVINTLLLSLFQFLSKIGFGLYSRSGYTMVLRKQG